MTEKQIKTRRKIIETLIDRGQASASQLSDIANVSRVTVLNEINSFLSEDIIAKNGVKYGFSGDLVAVILKADKTGGEILGYVFGEGVISRASFDFSEMVTYQENVRGFAKQAEEYSDFLKRRYKRVICCFIYGGEESYPYPLPSFFALSCSKEELLATAVLEKYGRGLCVSCEEDILYVLNDGKYVRSIPCEIGGQVAALEKVLSLFAPDMILLDGHIDVSNIPCKSKIKVHKVTDPAIYEREILIRVLIK